MSCLVSEKLTFSQLESESQIQVPNPGTFTFTEMFWMDFFSALITFFE